MKCSYPSCNTVILNNNKYCSKECRYDHVKLKSRETRQCSNPQCTNTFEVGKSSTKTSCCLKCSRKSPEYLAQIKTTNIAKYGVDNPSKSPEIIEKIRKTNQKKYGVDSYYQTEEFKEKSKKTKKEKYNEEFFNNRDKCNATKTEKYGDPTYCNKEQIITTNQERYGANSFTSTEEGKEKVTTTNLERYGEECYFDTDKFKETYQQMLSERGVINISQLPEVKQKNRDSHLKRFFGLLINSDRLKEKVIPLFSINDYKGVKEGNQYEFQCKICSTKFYTTIDNGTIPRCPKCYPPLNGESIGEIELYEFICTLVGKENVIRGNRKILKGRELDIYIPSMSIAIEYNGLYWHTDLHGKGTKSYHISKTEECEKLGIQLIHVWDFEWLNKQEIVKSIIRQKLSYVKTKIYARKCNVQEINNEQYTRFILDNHLQGIKSSSIKIGLFQNEELLSIMSFSKKGINQYEMDRFCNKINTSVIGGADRLFKYFLKIYNPKFITTFSDRRFFDGKIYLKLGFEFKGFTSPNYQYTHRFKVIGSRLKFQKHKLKGLLEIFDPNLSEWQNMQLNKYDRIWDCGHRKFTWSNHSH